MDQMRYMAMHGIVTEIVWPVEVYGFIWGILLASLKNEFTKFFMING